MLGDNNITLGALRPLDAPSGKIFYTQNEYFSISNWVFNFNFLALVVSEILRVPNLHTLAEKFLVR